MVSRAWNCSSKKEVKWSAENGVEPGRYSDSVSVYSEICWSTQLDFARSNTWFSREAMSGFCRDVKRRHLCGICISRLQNQVRKLLNSQNFVSCGNKSCPILSLQNPCRIYAGCAKRINQHRLSSEYSRRPYNWSAESSRKSSLARKYSKILLHKSSSKVLRCCNSFQFNGFQKIRAKFTPSKVS